MTRHTYLRQVSMLLRKSYQCNIQNSEGNVQMLKRVRAFVATTRSVETSIRGRSPTGGTIPPQHSIHRTNSSNTTQLSAAVVYESPLANVVGKLRGVSLMTAIVGAVGVPAMVALKGTIPDVGMLAVASTFVTGSIGSTAAIHYIFGPYVYHIVRIPVRVCSYPPPAVEPLVGEASSANINIKKDRTPETAAANNSQTTADKPSNNKPTLLKAITKSIFLRPKEVIFDPETDVERYNGFRPMCNFIAKGIPLYVHPEFVHDNALRKVLKLEEERIAANKPTKENPDDFL